MSPAYAFTYAGVYNACNTSNGQFLATWEDDNNNQYPTFSFYNSGTGWSEIDIISNTQVLFNANVIPSCDPTSGKFLATWTDQATYHPVAAVYTPGSGWSSIDLLLSSTAFQNVFSCFDSTTGQFLVTWADLSNSPKYAFYDLNTGWGVPQTLAGSSLAGNVVTSYDSINDQFLAVWSDQGTGRPMYSFYSSGMWSVAQPVAFSANVENNVECCWNPVTGQFIATWVDINLSPNLYYSLYTPGSGWSVSDLLTVESNGLDNLIVSCDSKTGNFLATWSELNSTHFPSYSFYTTDSGWGPVGFIPDGACLNDVITSFDPISGRFMATWPDAGTLGPLYNPAYSLYSFPASSVPRAFARPSNYR